MFLDREQAVRYLLSLDDINNYMKMITHGLKITTVKPRNSNNEIDVLIKFPEKYQTLTTLDDITIINAVGNEIPFSNLVTRKAVYKSLLYIESTVIMLFRCMLM